MRGQLLQGHFFLTLTKQLPPLHCGPDRGLVDRPRRRPDAACSGNDQSCSFGDCGKNLALMRELFNRFHHLQELAARAARITGPTQFR